MTAPTSLREIPQNHIFREGDTFVLFGELFGRGYANGLVNEARRAGMTIIGITVGRRDEDGSLRALTAEEHALAEKNLGGTIINVPLMAGFDMDAPAGTPNPTELLSGLTLKNWQEEKLDWDQVKACQEVGVQRFKNSVAQVMEKLDPMIGDGSNLFFAHTMAGGILRAKVFLTIANRIYKGRGKRFTSSRALIESDLGKLLLMNFDEVTANTFQYLIEGSAAIRERLAKTGGQSRYTAYGYHGTEILIDDTYQWQTYTNYTQGYAKMRLESIATQAWEQGIKATVYNCPEIRTNSSDIFAGVELPLFSLLAALKKEGGGDWAQAQYETCQALLKEEVSLESLLAKLDDYTHQEAIVAFRDFAAWPMDNSETLAELMIGASYEITDMHKDAKALITDHLSSLVLDGTGPLIFNNTSEPAAPVLWLNHDILAKQLVKMNSGH